MASPKLTAYPSAASIARRTSLLHKAAAKRILILDGAMGKANPTAEIARAVF